VLADALVRELLQVLLVFVRVGTALMIVPGFGERYVLARQRLLLGLLLSAVVAPTVAVPAVLPDEPARLAGLVAGELAVGVFLGAATRLALAALHVAGTIVAFQSGLSAAALFDPNEAGQGTLPGNLFSTTALAVMFAADLHHLLLRALAASYERLPLGGGLPTGDAVRLLTAMIDGATRTGLELAAPVVIASLLANLALGVLGRLMPALQLLAVALPLQLLLALALLLLGVAGVAAGFGRAFEQGLAFLDGSGG
jgi:flagellar biosynthesis protein FliR